MQVVHHPAPSTAAQSSALIEEVKKIATAKAKTTNELPQIMFPSNRFSAVWGQASKSELLAAFVERADTTFNVYWKQIEDAAEYKVEVYKYAATKWYKLTEIYVARHNGFTAITDLVGEGFVFRVIAEDHSGKELAKSAGIIIGSKSAE